VSKIGQTHASAVVQAGALGGLIKIFKNPLGSSAIITIFVAVVGGLIAFLTRAQSPSIATATPTPTATPTVTYAVTSWQDILNHAKNGPANYILKKDINIYQDQTNRPDLENAPGVHIDCQHYQISKPRSQIIIAESKGFFIENCSIPYGIFVRESDGAKIINCNDFQMIFGDVYGIIVRGGSNVTVSGNGTEKKLIPTIRIFNCQNNAVIYGNFAIQIAVSNVPIADIYSNHVVGNQLFVDSTQANIHDNSIHLFRDPGKTYYGLTCGDFMEIDRAALVIQNGNHNEDQYIVEYTVRNDISSAWGPSIYIDPPLDQEAYATIRDQNILADGVCQ
jgi:hypothetical protein